MKRLIVFLSAAVLATGVCIGFSFITGNELVPDPPPRSMLEAYAMALQALGPATNDLYCISATRSRSWCREGEWVFSFNRNQFDHKLVFVAMKPYIDPTPNARYRREPWPLIEVREMFGSKAISTNRFSK